MLRDFEEPDHPLENHPVGYSQEELDKACADAFEAGAQSAQDAVDKIHMTALNTIGGTLVEAQSTHKAAIAAEVDALKTHAHAFLKEVCNRFCVQYEMKTVENFLDKLLIESNSRAAAALSISTASEKHLAAEIKNLVSAKDAAAFLSIKTDTALAPGECRLEWRGGSLAHLLKPYEDVIEDLISSTIPNNENTSPSTETRS